MCSVECYLPFGVDYEEYRSNKRQGGLVDVLYKIHDVFYYHTDSENHENMCLNIFRNLYNQIINGNYFTPFDLFERYTNEYRYFGEQQPGFSEIEFIMLRDDAERRVLYYQL